MIIKVFICQTDVRWLLDAEPRAQVWVTSYEIRGEWSGTEAGFSLIFILFSPADDHSTGDPYSFITAPSDVQ
jgi:hypothetical protein